MSILIRDKCLLSYLIHLQVWWPPNGDVSMRFGTDFNKQDMIVCEAISTLSLTLIHRRLWAPCIVSSNYLFAKWILSAHSPWCCRSSCPLLGKSRWGEWQELAGCATFLSVWHDQTYYIHEIFLFTIELNKYTLALSSQYMLFNFAVICFLCLCKCLWILACCSSLSIEIGLLHSEHKGKLSFPVLVLAFIVFPFI